MKVYRMQGRRFSGKSVGGAGEAQGIRAHIPVCERLGFRAVKVENSAPLYYGHYKA